MYPYLRFATSLLRAGRQTPLQVGEIHVSTHRVRLGDIDVWGEMNNGRILTVFELGRVEMFRRHGFFGVMRRRRWAGTIAGASVRYRRRMKLGDRLVMRSRILGWDARFSYAEQALFRDDEATAHALFRMAITDRSGLIPSTDFATEIGQGDSPPLPDWVVAWGEADAGRPWPPLSGTTGP